MFFSDEDEKTPRLKIKTEIAPVPKEIEKVKRKMEVIGNTKNLKCLFKFRTAGCFLNVHEELRQKLINFFLKNLREHK